MAHHHFYQPFFSHLSHRNRTDTRPPAQYRTAIGDCLNFTQFVCDKHHRLTLTSKTSDHLHQLLHFLWSENCGGFIKNEHPSIAVKHFENLNTLLHANSDVLNFRVWVHRKSVALAQLSHCAMRSTNIRASKARTRLDAKNDILTNG